LYSGKSGKGVLGDALMELDDSVGMVIKALETNNVREKTIVFMTGDNGPPEDQCDWGGSKGPFMGWRPRSVLDTFLRLRSAITCVYLPD
jgi:arylsulfatase A-like enzyme